VNAGGVVAAAGRESRIVSASTPLRGTATGVAVLLGVAVSALAGTVGADYRWAAALGRAISAGVPLDSVPFATASSHAWVNVPVLSELFSWGVYDAFGLRGLWLAHVAAVALALAALAYAMRRAGAADAGRGAALILVAFGAFGALAVARLELFSLVFFAVALAIVHVDVAPRSRVVWALPPLFALWANLHGGVLVGVAVVGVYLVVERLRRRPVETALVLAASAAALFATPALLRTPRYFLGVMRGEAPRRGAGMWAPLSFSALDVALCISVALLAALAWRARAAHWEVVAAIVLAGLTVHAARSGVWLVMLLAIPAARGVRRGRPLRGPATAALATVFAVLVVIGIAHGPAPSGATPSLVQSALAAAHGRPVLAQDLLAEQIALAGGRIVVGNPLDAFSRADQRAYLDWAAGRPGGDRLLCQAATILVHPGTGAARRIAGLHGFRRLHAEKRAALYVRTSTDPRCRA
jgi:hypothetical protein